jgi:hypothetical protein
MNWQNFRDLTREELYTLVWSAPMVKVAKQFGLSDVGLKKICRKHDIPVPGRGYWRKLETHKRAKKLSLPRRNNDETIRIYVYDRSQPFDRGTDNPTVNARREFEEMEENKIVVPDNLEKPHPLVASAKQHLKGQKPDEYGMLHYGTGYFSLRVGPESVDRVLRIVDALLKAFVVRGFEFKLRTGERDRSGILVDGEAMSFSIEDTAQRQAHRMTEEEKRKKEKGEWWSRAPAYDFVPKGKFTLKLDGGYTSSVRGTFTDGERQKLEDKLHEVIVSMTAIAEVRKAERRTKERREEWLRDENARRAEVRKQQEVESAALKKLETDTRDWNLATQMRNYIAAVEAKRRNEGADLSPESEVGRWLHWARAQADRLDPLTISPPSVLDEENPKELQYWQVRWVDD